MQLFATPAVKELKNQATKAANIGADSFARLGHTPFRDVIRQAESAIHEMLER
jgi:hypothetical protein